MTPPTLTVEVTPFGIADKAGDSSFWATVRLGGHVIWTESIRAKNEREAKEHGLSCFASRLQAVLELPPYEGN